MLVDLLKRRATARALMAVTSSLVIICATACTDSRRVSSVHPHKPASSSEGIPTSDLDNAVTSYEQWLTVEMQSLISATQRFSQDVQEDNLSQAELDYPAAVGDYAEIAPVFGGLQSGGDFTRLYIDDLYNDLPYPFEFSGFHRLEQAMWQYDSLAGVVRDAGSLVSEEQELQGSMPSLDLGPQELAGVAVSLLQKIDIKDLSGEEESYSGLDFVDVNASLSGAMKVFNVFETGLMRVDPSLVTDVMSSYASLTATLAGYRQSPGDDGTGYVDFDQVSQTERAQLSDQVLSLASEMVQVESWT